jgi:uncharacterized protein (DUF1810 family)
VWETAGAGRPAQFNLERFVDAQRPVYGAVLAELRAGRKQSHWMWFVFPQLRGLGRSPTSQYYGVSSLAEASAYLGHPVLGTRLAECTAAVTSVEGRSAREIFGSPDDLKFRSCLTLFLAAGPLDPVFDAALDKYFSGQPDERTLQLLQLL